MPLMNRSRIPGILLGVSLATTAAVHAANPIITDVFTADPAPLVHGDTVYLYCGQDEAQNDRDGYRMNRWLCFSSKDMTTWKPEGSPLAPKDFRWALGSAWASEVIERNGKFYWCATVEHNASHPDKAIEVAVSDSPTGPFKDARGSALVTNDMTKASKISWDDIDPTVHQGIITFKGVDYFFYHTGALQRPNVGGSHRRAVCVDYLHYNADGTMKRVVQTSEGVSSQE